MTVADHGDGWHNYLLFFYILLYHLLLPQITVYCEFTDHSNSASKQSHLALAASIICARVVKMNGVNL